MERGHLFIPLIVIVGVLIMGYSAPYAALCGIISVVPVAAMRKTTRHYVTVENILDALENGARNVLSIAAACACAGIVVGVIDITGLGLTFSNFVIEAAQDRLVIALILSMVAGIILGMGMPTTPAYIVQVALLVPALVKLGVQVEAAHLFVFYFAILSAITPPWPWRSMPPTPCPTPRSSRPAGPPSNWGPQDSSCRSCSSMNPRS